MWGEYGMVTFATIATIATQKDTPLVNGNCLYGRAKHPSACTSDGLQDGFYAVYAPCNGIGRMLSPLHSPYSRSPPHHSPVRNTCRGDSIPTVCDTTKNGTSTVMSTGGCCGGGMLRPGVKREWCRATAVGVGEGHPIIAQDAVIPFLIARFAFRARREGEASPSRDIRPLKTWFHSGYPMDDKRWGMLSPLHSSFGEQRWENGTSPPGPLSIMERGRMATANLTPGPLSTWRGGRWYYSRAGGAARAGLPGEG